MNTPTTQNRIPSQTQTTTSSQFSLQTETWAVVLSMWITFGLSTILNSIAFKNSENEFGIVQLPQTMREAIWLVLGIWGSGYLAGFIVGLMYRDLRSKGTVMRSVALGFTIGIGFRLLFINVFPTTPTTGFGVVRDIFQLRPLPVYYTFLLLTLVVGPALTALASFTGLLLAQEWKDLFVAIPRFQINSQSVLLSALLPLTIILLILGVSNVYEADTAREIRQLAELREISTPPFFILYFNTLSNPSINMILGAFVGILIGLSYAANNRTNAALSASLGIMIHVLLVILFEEIFAPYTPTQEQSVEFAYTDHLNLITTDIVFFALLWAGPILTAAASAFAVHNIRDAFASSKHYSFDDAAFSHVPNTD